LLESYRRKWITLTVMKSTAMTEKRANQNTNFINNKRASRNKTQTNVNNVITADITCIYLKTLMKKHCGPLATMWAGSPFTLCCGMWVVLVRYRKRDKGYGLTLNDII
jgi:hypothetical protein